VIDVISITLEGKFYYAERSMPIRRYKYVSDSGTITENAEVELRYKRGHLILGLHATADTSKLAATFRVADTLPINSSMDITIDIFEAGDNGS
jgi:hypothetical protein